MSKKQYTESLQGRIYQRGIHLLDQDIACIHRKLECARKEKLEQGFQLTDEIQKEIIKKVSKELKMDKRTIQKYDGNSIQHVGGNRKYNELMEQFILELVKQNPTFYLRELKIKLQNIGIRRSIGTISNFLTKKLGLSRKKVIKVCFYRTTERVQNLRREFRLNIQNYHPYRFFYIDESHFDSETLEVMRFPFTK
jgi:hypothetical protein